MRPHARAALISGGNRGGHAVVTDTVAGLDWLSPTATLGLSLNAVSLLVAPGGSLEGWSISTTSQIQNLMSTLGFPNSPTSGMSPVWGPPAQGGVALFGITSTNDGDPSLDLNFTGGKFSTGNATTNGIASFYVVVSASSGTLVNAGYEISLCCNRLNQADPDFGAFLVRATPVPLPAAVWLLLSGLAGTATLLRRRAAA